MATSRAESDPFGFVRPKHFKYFMAHLHGLPQPYLSLDNIRLNALFFALSGLSIMDEPIRHKSKSTQEIVDWIYSCQVPEDAEYGGGFRGSPYLGYTGDGSTGPRDSGHLAMTYCALLCLRILGDDLSRVNRSGCVKLLKTLQQENGCFMACGGGAEQDLRFVYCACATAALIDDFSGIDRDKVLEFIKKCQTYEGGFGQTIGSEAHGGTTFCAAAALYLLDALPVEGSTKPAKDDVLGEEGRQQLLHWTVSKQISGFCGRTNKPPDTCYSFWIGGTLEIMGFGDMPDAKANSSFLLTTQDENIGGFGKVQDALPGKY
eukprot:Clim_evm10s183 gene=Clim_evmTU10s183